MSACVVSPSRAEPGSLSAAERQMLELEAIIWSSPGRKNSQIRQRLAMNPTEYYLRLNHLIDVPAASLAAPHTVNRLRRLRDRRRAAR